MTSSSAAAGRRGHDVRGLLLHRPAGHRAPHRQPGRGDRARGHARASPARSSCAPPRSSGRWTRCWTSRTAVAPASGPRSTPTAWPGASRAAPTRVPRGWLRCGRLARAGYPVGLTIAPIMPVDGWREEYGALLDAARPTGAVRRSTSPSSASPTGSRRTARTCSRAGTRARSWRWTPDAALPQAREVRRGQVRLPAGRDARAARVVRRASSSGGCPPPASSTGPDLLRAATRRRRTGRGSASS